MLITNQKKKKKKYKYKKWHQVSTRDDMVTYRGMLNNKTTAM